MALTEIFRSADLRKRLSSTGKGNSSTTKIFETPNKRKKKSRERSGKLK